MQACSDANFSSNSCMVLGYSSIREDTTYCGHESQVHSHNLFGKFKFLALYAKKDTEDRPSPSLYSPKVAQTSFTYHDVEKFPYSNHTWHFAHLADNTHSWQVICTP
jgi:hypothetical protein